MISLQSKQNMMYHVKVYSLSSQNTARCYNALTQLDETKRDTPLEEEERGDGNLEINLDHDASSSSSSN